MNLETCYTCHNDFHWNDEDIKDDAEVCPNPYIVCPHCGEIIPV